MKGIVCFGMGMTLREGNREYYYAQLDRHFPGLKERYIAVYGNAYQLASPRQPQLTRIFRDTCRRNGILYRPDEVFAYLHEFPGEGFEQTSLF